MACGNSSSPPPLTRVHRPPWCLSLPAGAPLAHGSIICMSIFIACQLVLAQIPSFHDLSWVSAMGAVMSFG